MNPSTPVEQNRQNLQQNLDALAGVLGTTSAAPLPQANASQSPAAAVTVVPPVNPAPQIVSQPNGGVTEQSLLKRERDARSAQSDMSKERNALQAVLSEARGLQSSLLSLMEKNAGLKEALSGVSTVEFSRPEEIDAELEREAPWLFSVLSRLSDAIAGLAANQNALAAAFTGYSESVGRDRDELQQKNEDTMAEALDDAYGVRWREIFSPEKPLAQLFGAWLQDELIASKSQRYIGIIQSARFASEVEPVFNEFLAAHPGAFDTPTPTEQAAPPRPGEGEARATPNRSAAMETPTANADGIVPLSHAEAANYQSLIAGARTPEARAMLIKRHEAYREQVLKEALR